MELSCSILTTAEEIYVVLFQSKMNPAMKVSRTNSQEALISVHLV
jgi:hypothetical protein